MRKLHSYPFFVFWIVLFLFQSIEMSGQTGFSPGTISGLKLWLIGDSVQTIVSPNVDKSFDLSPVLNDAIQSGSAQQPISVNSALNGHDVIRFDGVDDHLQFTEITDIRTVFWVVQEGAASSNFRSLLGNTNVYDFLRGANQEIWSSSFANSAVTSGITRLNETPVNGTTTALPSNFSILSLVTTGNVTADNFSNDRNSSRIWQGDLAELLIYNQALSAFQVDSVEQYLHNKYAPPVYLGPDTTVCSFPYILRAKKDYFTNYSWTGGSIDDSLIVNTAGTYTISTTDVFGSLSSDTIIIGVDGSAFTVNLGNDVSICSGQQVLINAGPTHLSYLWSTGSTSNSILSNSASTYTVTVTDCLGNISSDVINTVLVPYPAFSLGSDTLICFNGSNPLVLSSNLSGSYTYLWSTSSTASTLSVSSTGTYSLKLTNPGCSTYDTINVQVDNFPQIATLGPDVTICTGNSIYLTSGASQAASYMWLDGSTNDSLLISSPVSPSNYSLTATSTNGCIKKDTIVVTVAGSAPTVAFSISTACEGDANVFTDASGAPAGNSITSRNWDFGDISFGSGTPVSHTYADSGSYTAKLTVTTNMGCSAALSKTFTVYPNPQADFSATNLFENTNTLFLDQTTTNGYSITNWKWSFGDIASGSNDSSALQNPTHLFQSSGTYPVKLTVQNNKGCSNVSFTQNIVIKVQPFSPNTISGLKLWLIGDSVQTSISPNVNMSFDLSPALNDAIQSTAGKQPILVNSALNGHDVVRFDGVDDYLQFTEISDIRTVFWVVQEGVASSNFRSLLGNTNVYDFLRGANQEIWSSSFANSAVTSGVTRLNETPVNGTTTALPSNFSILSLVTTGNVTADNFSNDRNSSKIWQGDLAELLIYNQALSAFQVDSVEQYLHTKYAPPVDLGPDTTVCGFPYILRAKKNYFTNYSWTGGSSDDSLVVNTAGTYTIGTTDVFGSTSSDTIIIGVDGSAFTVNLGSDVSICSGQQVSINAGPSHLSYLWSTGSTSNSILSNSASTYTVTVTDCLGNTSSDIINTVLVPYPAFSLGSDTLICFNGSNPLVLSSNLSGSYTYLWSTSSTASTLSVSSTGTYSLKLTNPGCSTYDTINVQVDNFPQIATLGPDVTICTGNSVYLTSGAAQAASYSWSDGSTNDSLLITSLVSPSNYSLTATSSNGCVKKDTISVSIKGSAPTVAFSISTACEGDANVFTDASSPPAGNSITSRDWDFGDLSLGSGTPVSHTYADSGSYTAKLTITTDVGCTADLSKIVTVYPYPTGSFTIANLCERDSVLFTASATDYGYPITQWGWSFGEPTAGPGFQSMLQNPKHYYANATTYTVSLTIQNAAGCATTVNNSITLKQSPVTDYSTSLLCEKTSIAFTDNTPATLALSGGSWNFGDGSAVSPLINPTHTYSVSGTYTVTHTMTYTNTCSNTMTKVLTVNPKPTALYATGNACVSTPIDFTDTSQISSGTITAWLWTFGVAGPTSALQNEQYTFNTPVSPQIKLLVTSDQGCKDSISKTIVVRPLPFADFTYSPANGSPPLAVTFTNTSSGAATYAWDFGDTNTDTQTNTSNTFVDTGSYNVTLIATTSFGCVDTTIKVVDALEPHIDVAVQNVTAALNNNFLTITAQIANKGTVDVTSLLLTIRLDDGTIIQENWTGVLLKGGVLLDTITATIYLKDTKHFVCVSAVKPNSQEDENPSDNESCIATDKSSFEVLQPYPVPAGESITLAVLIPNSTSILEVNICNARGQTLRAIYSGVIAEGLQMFRVNLLDVAKGFYAFTVTYEGKTVVRKFIVD